MIFEGAMERGPTGALRANGKLQCYAESVLIFPTILR
jgi:hypothetical protein